MGNPKTSSSRKSIFPSFSVRRNSVATYRCKGDEADDCSSTAATTNNIARDPISSRHDDSIDELASRLLEDSDIDHLQTGPVTRSSQTVDSRTSPAFISETATGLPQLPQLVFTEDDAWAMNTAPIVVTARDTNETLLSNLPATYFGTGFPKLSTHSRTSSTPAIPRKSSKRKSARRSGAEQTLPLKAKKIDKNSISPPKPFTAPRVGPSSNNAVDINKKIEAMLAASKALKPGIDDSIVHDYGVPTKKRRFKDHNVFLKMKTAIKTRTAGKLQDEMLNNMSEETALTISQLRMNEDDMSQETALGTSAIRLNEGDNFKTTNVFHLTGQGNVRRKPLPDDGRSLRSRKSTSDDPFCDPPQFDEKTRKPTDFEQRLQEDLSIPFPDLPSSTFSLKEESSRENEGIPRTHVADTGELLSSSPIAQSTPRIRLEPAFEKDGRKTLRKVPAESPSLFDQENFSLGGQFSDMDLDISYFEKNSGSSLVDVAVRKSCLGRDHDYTICAKHHTKKHPSPGKVELERLKRAVGQNPEFGRSERLGQLKDDVGDTPNIQPRGKILATREPNSKLQGASKRWNKGKRFGIFPKLELTRSTSLTSDVFYRNKGQSLLTPEPTETTKKMGKRVFNLRDDEDESMMDIDELQWDETALIKKN